jgi:hypothetical protein
VAEGYSLQQISRVLHFSDFEQEFYFLPHK